MQVRFKRKQSFWAYLTTRVAQEYLILKRCEFSSAVHAKIQKTAKICGVDLLFTVTSNTEASWTLELEAAALREDEELTVVEGALAGTELDDDDAAGSRWTLDERDRFAVGSVLAAGTPDTTHSPQRKSSLVSLKGAFHAL